MNAAAAPRIVLATVGSEGDLRPFLAIGMALARRGRRVAVASHLMHAERVAEAGLAFIDASGRPPVADVAPLVARAYRPLRGPRYVIGDLAAADAAASYARLQAACADDDLLVTSTLAFAAQVLAERRGLRWVSAMLAPAGFMSAGDPPATGIGRFDRYLRARPERGAQLTRLAAHVSRRWTAPVRALRRQLGLPPQASAGDPLYHGQHAPARVLALFSPLLGAPQSDWPRQTRQPGFARYLPPRARLAPVLVAFLDAGPPPLVFSLGSTAVHVGERFLLESLDAVRRLGMRAVLMTGSEALRARLPAALPPGVLAVRAAEHALLFPRAAAVIHHGGIGTSAEALFAARPMLVVPHGFDQPDNAARLVRLGVAEVLPRRRYRGPAVAVALARLCSQPGYRRRAQACAAQLGGEGGAEAAADLIEAELRR